MRPRAVFFDFDGVIADTENYHIAAWQRTFAAMGWVLADEVCARSMEQDDRAFLAEMFARKKINDGDVEGWVRRKQAITRTMLADAPRLYPGVSFLVKRLSGMPVKLAVVTTTWRENVAAVLDACGLARAFERVVGKEDVSAPKPDAEGYIKAVAALGVSPSESWAIEDSPSGLSAARGAGLNVLAVGHRRPIGPWHGDAPFLPDLTETKAVLEALGFSNGNA